MHGHGLLDCEAFRALGGIIWGRAVVDSGEHLHICHILIGMSWTQTQGKVCNIPSIYTVKTIEMVV